MVRNFRAIPSALIAIAIAGVACPAAAGTSRFVRTSLDEAAVSDAPTLPPRIIRTRLDDADLPFYDPSRRLIRISLDEDGAPYAPLAPSDAPGRRVRTTLD
jgi:hypothetical protein